MEAENESSIARVDEVESSWAALKDEMTAVVAAEKQLREDLAVVSAAWQDAEDLHQASQSELLKERGRSAHLATARELAELDQQLEQTTTSDRELRETSELELREAPVSMGDVKVNWRQI